MLKYLVWLDLEMTGLCPHTHRIIEIATVVTDRQLQVVDVGPEMAIHQDEAHLAMMDKWNRRTHAKTGLIERVRSSQYNEQIAQEETLAFLRRYLKPHESPLCGNTVHQDKRFLYRYMPQLADFFHYRNLDVSTVKQLAQCWQPKLAGAYKKESAHTALADVHASIDELRYYQKHFFQLEEQDG